MQHVVDAAQLQNQGKVDRVGIVGQLEKTQRVFEIAGLQTAIRHDARLSRRFLRSGGLLQFERKVQGHADAVGEILVVAIEHALQHRGGSLRFIAR